MNTTLDKKLADLFAKFLCYVINIICDMLITSLQNYKFLRIYKVRKISKIDVGYNVKSCIFRIFKLKKSFKDNGPVVRNLNELKRVLAYYKKINFVKHL